VAAQGTPPHWLTYIETPNIDETVSHATALGARTYVPPKDIPTVGRFAVLADPQGAVFAIFAPLSQSPAPDGDPRLGDFSWHELLTTDHRAAFDFYEKLFGWTKTSAMDMGAMGVYQMYGQNGVTVGGMYDIQPGMQAPPSWLPYIRVDSADRAAERAKEEGATIINGPMEVPGGDRIAILFDPQGAAIAVHSKKS
jgi:predicted enzyme related to lactoylglutathione lyase